CSHKTLAFLLNNTNDDVLQVFDLDRLPDSLLPIRKQRACYLMPDDRNTFARCYLFGCRETSLSEIDLKQRVVPQCTADQTRLSNAVAVPLDDDISANAKDGDAVIVLQICLKKLVFIVGGVGSTPEVPPLIFSVIIRNKRPLFNIDHTGTEK